MKTKEEIVANWLPRYTGLSIDQFGHYILLTNFQLYVEMFAQRFDVPILGEKRNMPTATAEGMTIINFGMGSPNAATVMDLLSAIMPKAVLFLGKCGGLKPKNKLGDLILPIAAIRSDGTSNDYLPRKFPPCRPSTFSVQSPTSSATKDSITGPEPFLPPTKGCGNGMNASKNTSKNPSHGHRHGNCHHIHCRICQFNPLRSPPAGLRSTYDLFRREDRSQ